MSELSKKPNWNISLQAWEFMEDDKKMAQNGTELLTLEIFLEEDPHIPSMDFIPLVYMYMFKSYAPPSPPPQPPLKIPHTGPAYLHVCSLIQNL